MPDVPGSSIDFFPHGRIFSVSDSFLNIMTGDITTQRQSVAELQAYLQPISDASHTRNQTVSPPDSVCTDGTRTPVIDRITTWGNSSIGPNDHVFILTGCAGSGKSAVSQTVSAVFHKTGKLGASFFFHQGSEDRSVMTKFTETLASQLAVVVPEMVPYMLKGLRSTRDPLLPSTPLDVKLELLIFSPFKEACRPRTLFSSSLPRPLIIVIDGLDECQDISLVEVFMTSVLDFFRRNPLLPLRFFVATRTEPHISLTFSKDEVVQYDLGPHGSNNDIDIFFRASFSPAVLKRYHVIQTSIQEGNRPWPHPYDLYCLSRHTKGSFILAAAMIRYIFEGCPGDGLTPRDRLSLALQMRLNLDGLYAHILSQTQHELHVVDIISTMTLINTPLSISALAELLCLPAPQIAHRLLHLQAFIQAPGEQHEPVTFRHVSVREFFRNEARSGRFYVSPVHHLWLSYLCFLRNLRSGTTSDPGQRTCATAYCLTNCTVHWHSFVRECQRGCHVDEIENFSQGPAYEGVSRHAFLSTLFLWELFHLGSGIEQSQSLRTLHPLLLSYIFTDWARQLVLAVEEAPDPIITKWLNQPIGQVIQCSPFWGRRSFHLSEDEFEAFQTNIRSALHVVEKTLSSINSSPLALLTQSEVNNSTKNTLSPVMALAALESIGSHCHEREVDDETGLIRLEFCIISKFRMADGPILIELYDEPKDIDQDSREVRH